MRKITEEARDAFNANVRYNNSNTAVVIYGDEVQLVLHGHIIAKKNELGTFINNCGDSAYVTKERLNAILDYREGIHQKNWIWYFTDKNGTVTEFPSDTWVKVAS